MKTDITKPNIEDMKKEGSVWSDIDKAFSKPITSNDRSADYIPTQIIAELFKTNGFDGVYYKSMLHDGFNVVLFDIDTAKLSNCHFYQVKKIIFEFSRAGNPYF